MLGLRPIVTHVATNAQPTIIMIKWNGFIFYETSLPYLFILSDFMKDAQHLIELTCKKYAECKSYSDVGVACTDNDAAIRDIRFKTAFARDDRFRFEFRQYHPHLGKSGPDTVSVVWSNGTSHTFCSSIIGSKDFGSLIGPVSAATGISAASVIHIPSILMPDLIAINPVWLQLEGARILKEEKLDDKKCLVLMGFRRVSEYSVWIDSEKFCIRKIVSTMRSAASQNVTMSQDMVTTYNYSQIIFDQTIAQSDLEPNFPEE